jgi:hypothetical protein
MQTENNLQRSTTSVPGSCFGQSCAKRCTKTTSELLTQIASPPPSIPALHSGLAGAKLQKGSFARPVAEPAPSGARGEVEVVSRASHRPPARCRAEEGTAAGCRDRAVEEAEGGRRAGGSRRVRAAAWRSSAAAEGRPTARNRSRRSAEDGEARRSELVGEGLSGTGKGSGAERRWPAGKNGSRRGIDGCGEGRDAGGLEVAKRMRHAATLETSRLRSG